MKLKELLKELNQRVKADPDILEYDVYTEQLTEQDKRFKRKPVRDDIPWHHKDNGQGWETIKDGDGWEYFQAHGFNTVFTKEKVITINVNF
jgi:hypothetical protein